MVATPTPEERDANFRRHRYWTLEDSIRQALQARYNDDAFMARLHTAIQRDGVILERLADGS